MFYFKYTEEKIVMYQSIEHAQRSIWDIFPRRISILSGVHTSNNAIPTKCRGYSLVVPR